MKKMIALLLGMMIILIVSCKKDQPVPTEEKGKLTIGVSLSLNISEVNNKLKSTGQTENFNVTIYRSDGTETMSFPSALAMPDTVELAPGEYYVEAHSGNDLPAAFENPFYYGVSDVFTISSNTQRSVRVICELANTIVSVVYSNNLKNNFSDYSTTVSSAIDSLVYTKDETRWGYFRTMPLEIRVSLSWQEPDGSGKIKNLSGSIPAAQANRHYEVQVDASVDKGGATFQILLNDTTIPVEIVEVKEDSTVAPAGELAYGDLLITEIMYDPSAMSDTYGEWFEIYNNSGHEVNLHKLVLKRDETNSHSIGDSIVLSPGEFWVFQRTDTATEASNACIYGSAITLSNTGGVLGILNESTESGDGALIFSVDYGGTDFPSGSGASISLNPTMMNIADAVRGTSWCISTSIYGKGDKGTPGMMNDGCP